MFEYTCESRLKYSVLSLIEAEVHASSYVRCQDPLTFIIPCVEFRKFCQTRFSHATFKSDNSFHKISLNLISLTHLLAPAVVA